MTEPTQLERCGWFLQECLGADDVGHSGRTLFAHLKGTYELLRSWGVAEEVCVAGLFHSVYGTRVFRHRCLEPTARNRGLVAYMIGERAERLVYLFCVADRPHFAEAGAVGRELDDLCLIEKANLQEQRSNRQRSNRQRPLKEKSSSRKRS